MSRAVRKQAISRQNEPTSRILSWSSFAVSCVSKQPSQSRWQTGMQGITKPRRRERQAAVFRAIFRSLPALCPATSARGRRLSFFHTRDDDCDRAHRVRHRRPRHPLRLHTHPPSPVFPFPPAASLRQSIDLPYPAPKPTRSGRAIRFVSSAHLTRSTTSA